MLALKEMYLKPKILGFSIPMRIGFVEMRNLPFTSLSISLV